MALCVVARRAYVITCNHLVVSDPQVISLLIPYTTLFRSSPPGPGRAASPTPAPRARCAPGPGAGRWRWRGDRKSTRLNSSHVAISYAVYFMYIPNTRTKINIPTRVRNPLQHQSTHTYPQH